MKGDDEGRVSMSTESTFSSISINTGTCLSRDILEILGELCVTLAGRLGEEKLAVSAGSI